MQHRAAAPGAGRVLGDWLRASSASLSPLQFVLALSDSGSNFMRRFMSHLKFWHTPAVQPLCDSRNSGAGTISCLQVSPLGRLNFKNRTNRPSFRSSLPRSRSFSICNSQQSALGPSAPRHKRNAADARPQVKSCGVEGLQTCAR